MIQSPATLGWMRSQLTEGRLGLYRVKHDFTYGYLKIPLPIHWGRYVRR